MTSTALSFMSPALPGEEVQLLKGNFCFKELVLMEISQMRD